MIKGFYQWVNENEDLDLSSLIDLGLIDIKSYLESLLKVKLHGDSGTVAIPTEGEWFEIGLWDAVATQNNFDLEQSLEAYGRQPARPVPQYWDFILTGYRSGEIHAIWKGPRQNLMVLKKPLVDFTKEEFDEFVQKIVKSTVGDA